jgi:hypothetical protein
MIHRVVFSKVWKAALIASFSAASRVIEGSS